MEDWVIENGVTNTTYFYLGQLISDVLQTYFAITKLPGMLGKLSAAIAKLAPYFAGGGLQLAVEGVGAVGAAAGITAGQVEALVGALGVAGAGAAVVFADVTGIGHDAGKFIDSLTGQTSIGNPRSALNDKISVVNGAKSDARYLTKAEKQLANQILDDISDYIYRGDEAAYQRLIDHGLHTLTRDYKGWESVYLDADGRGMSNTARLLFKRTPDGVEWMVKIFH